MDESLNFEKVWMLMQQTFLETRQMFQETDKKFQETGKQIQELKQTVEGLSKRFGDLGNRLGEFVEEMVKPALVRLFQERNLDVHVVSQRVVFRRGKESFEIDLIVENERELVAVEGKSRLSREAVEAHVERLGKIKQFQPRYEGLDVYGAVAGMVVDEEAAKLALQEGLYLLQQSGTAVEIANPRDFVPRKF